MVEKVDPYDLLVVLVPGSLMVCWVPICFPAIGDLWPHVTLPSAFAALVMVALSILAGQLVQTLSSLMEPALFLSWGGRPSDRALREGIPGHLDGAMARRLRSRIERTAGSRAGDRAIFVHAARIADGAPGSLAPRFNALYGYQRSLLIALFLGAGLLILSMRWGAAAIWPRGLTWALLAGLVLAAGLTWNRARQRARYYVREVVMTADRVTSATEAE